jgi:hypothetical protein
MVVWFTTTYVIYYWNTRGRRGRMMAPCISVIYDICSCKSHHHMIMTTTAPCISVIYDICSGKWYTTIYVMYYWNSRGCRGRVNMVVWFTTTYVIYYNTWHMFCKSHNHMITTTTAPCISVIYDICSCISHHHMIMTIYNYICHALLKYKRRRCRDHMVMWFTTTYVIPSHM